MKLLMAAPIKDEIICFIVIRDVADRRLMIAKLKRSTTSIDFQYRYYIKISLVKYIGLGGSINYDGSAF